MLVDSWWNYMGPLSICGYLFCCCISSSLDSVYVLLTLYFRRVAPYGVSGDDRGCCWYISGACAGFRAFIVLLVFLLYLYFSSLLRSRDHRSSRPRGLLLMWCGYARCVVVDDDVPFSWWRVSRSILLFRGGGLFTLNAGCRLDPVIIIITIDNGNRLRV